MNELKTLKDFDYGGFDEADILKDALREEANKWVIKIETKIKEREYQFDDFGVDMGMRYAGSGEAIIGVIKHFFNIKDENIRNEKN